MAPDVPFYNISTAIRLNVPLNVAVLEEALNEIVRRHESLRTTFKTVDGQPVQDVSPSLRLPLPVTDLRHLSPAERETRALQLATEEACRPLDLQQGPLIRTGLLQLDEQEYVF